MRKDIRELIDNKIELNKSSVWVLENKKPFRYSEGCAAESYLNKAFSSAHDISSNSYELEEWIKDWSSEYHLSRKRSQLLRGFNFDKSKKVLEVGCGCGAITRFLGETFNSVVAVDGSLARAKLARMRTKDMENVSIICAPFQEIRFKEHFDIIFCVGVFEYSNMFVDDPAPFDFILKYFHEMLAPDGVIVIAIENQFGLKYFSSSREDHNDIMFDGLEGYPRYGNKERTFGFVELNDLIKKYFNSIDFYFPYPDYKIPSCVLSERFFSKVKAAELVGGFPSNSYLCNQKPLYDERLVLFELDKNRMLPFFSNSFLLVAGKNNETPVKLKSLGLIYSYNRLEKFQSITSFIEQDDGSVLVAKTPANAQDKVESSPITLHKCQCTWVDELSLHAQIRRRVKERDITIGELFAPCKPWLAALKSLSSNKDGIHLLDGKYIDCIWVNSFISNGECKFIDHEWQWHENIGLNVILIRSIYDFLNDVSSMRDLNASLRTGSKKYLINEIARSLGIVITRNDFNEFCRLESRLGQVVYGESYARRWISVKATLWNKSIFSFALSVKTIFITLCKRLINRSHRLLLECTIYLKSQQAE